MKNLHDDIIIAVRDLAFAHRVLQSNILVQCNYKTPLLAHIKPCQYSVISKLLLLLALDPCHAWCRYSRDFLRALHEKVVSYNWEGLGQIEIENFPILQFPQNALNMQKSHSSGRDASRAGTLDKWTHRGGTRIPGPPAGALPTPPLSPPNPSLDHDA